MRGIDMDVFYNKTVTVYNKYETGGIKGTEVWLPTVFENVRLQINKGANVTTSGLKDADRARLHIKRNSLPKPYLMPLQWQALPDEEKPNYFTLTGGTDFFVEGDVSVVEASKDGFFSYMKQKYDNCYKITNADCYDLIPHFEIGGE